ncbi:MAG: hypothetical protein K2X81_16925, partial [Candidatus Obscuribacterales bacterium]|nr:hypothetical protein [Candidatus Obscuribacterales bacterium]
GSRFLRGYILPGGVTSLPQSAEITQMLNTLKDLRHNIEPLLEMIQSNYGAIARMEGIGVVKKSLAAEFGIVGVACRASGIDYDTRRYFTQGVFPRESLPAMVESGGDILSRTNVRIRELLGSMSIIQRLLGELKGAESLIDLPSKLPANKQATGIVESFRGELIHLCFTDEFGKINRYVIKDASFNNWTAISIAVRNQLIADFPLCNKSLGLSYGGHDL